MSKRLIFAACMTMACATPSLADGANWGYKGGGGPNYWGDLKSSYAACKNGMAQSPIDITDARQENLPSIKFHYASGGNPAAVNNGRTIKVSVPQGRYIVIGGQQFNLLRFNFHAPSENTVEGKTFDMEAHFVHANAGGKLAIVAVLFEEGAANPALNKIWKKLPMHAGTKAGFHTVDVAPLLPKDKSYYHFMGSLTTPPCTEGVRWYVLKTPVSVGKKQLKKFHEIYNGNVRPAQPLNGREIKAN